MKKSVSIARRHTFTAELVISVLLVLIINLPLPAQEAGPITYEPAEQIIHPSCAQAADKNQCLWWLLADKIRKVMAREISELNSLKDTVRVRITFGVDQRGQVGHTPITIDFSNDLLLKNCKNDIERNLRRLPRLDVRHRKDDGYYSVHDFKYQFLVINSIRGRRLEIVAPVDPYQGGYILELPVFPGCEGLSYHNSNECFQQLMSEHITASLSYPKEAESQNIQGEVRIVCIINKEGLLEDIRARGGHYLLKQEAIRIMGLVPRFKPAMHNGVPVAIPYSVPITFKLSN